MKSATLAMQVAKLALRRPRLLPSLLNAAWRFRARDWYRRWPFLPLPPQAYLAWRWHTAYGAGAAGPDAHELERYLNWTSGMRRSRG